MLSLFLSSWMVSSALAVVSYPGNPDYLQYLDLDKEELSNPSLQRPIERVINPLLQGRVSDSLYDDIASGKAAAANLTSTAIRTTCLKDKDLENLVHNHRIMLFMSFHSIRSQMLVDTYAHCKDWMCPVAVRQSLYLDQGIYRDYFRKHLSTLAKHTDYIILSSYLQCPLMALEHEEVPETGHLFQLNTSSPKAFLLNELLTSTLTTVLHKQHKVDGLLFDSSRQQQSILSALAAHPQGAEAFGLLLQAMGFAASDVQNCHYIYAQPLTTSAFVLKTKVFLKLTKVMAKVMDLLDRDRDQRTASNSSSALAQTLASDAKYPHTNRQLAQFYFGSDYYQLHPFVLQQLVPFFMAVFGANIPGLRTLDYRDKAAPFTTTSPLLKGIHL